jgi:hypothetical protein
MMSCESSNACKLKLQDTRDNCWGTVMVNCGGELDFYYGPNGEFEYRVYSNRRDLMMEAGAVELLSTSTRGGATNAGGSFSLEDAVKDVVTTTTTTKSSSSSSSLRGGATGSKRK